MMSQKIQLFHGSSTVIRVPDLDMSRSDNDFGPGFYLSPEYISAAKWACRTNRSICNEYALELSGLSVHEFSLDQEWLEQIICNHTGQTANSSQLDDFDVLIGPSTEGILFPFIDMYEIRLISAEEVINRMRYLSYEKQYVLKTQNAITHLQYIEHTKLIGNEKNNFQKQYIEERKNAAKYANNLVIGKSR